jgi:hypothetical protein
MLLFLGAPASSRPAGVSDEKTIGGAVGERAIDISICRADHAGWKPALPAKNATKDGSLNIGAVLGVVSGFLDGKGYRYAVIGGVALISYGLPRTTVDLDFVVESTVQDDLIAFLESRGYQTLGRSKGYSTHLNGARS